MLTIRKEQMDVLSAYMLKGFEDRLVRHVRKDLAQPAQKLSEVQLRQLIQAGFNKAAAFQIDVERDVARFVDLMVRFGPDFEKTPDMAWSRAYLADPELPGGAKMDLIYHRLKKRGDVHG